MTNPTELRERLEDVLEASGDFGRKLEGGECDIEDDDLPAFMVIAIKSTLRRSSQNRRNVTLDFEIRLLAYKLCDNSAEEVRAGYEAGEAHLLTVSDALDPVYPALRLNDNGLDGLVEVGEPTTVIDILSHGVGLGAATFGGTRSKLQVTFIR